MCRTFGKLRTAEKLEGIQVGFFKKKPMKRSAAVCYKGFLLLQISVLLILWFVVNFDSHTFQFRFLYMNVVSCYERLTSVCICHSRH